MAMSGVRVQSSVYNAAYAASGARWSTSGYGSFWLEDVQSKARVQKRNGYLDEAGRDLLRIRGTMQLLAASLTVRHPEPD